MEFIPLRIAVARTRRKTELSYHIASNSVVGRRAVVDVARVHHQVEGPAATLLLMLIEELRTRDGNSAGDPRDLYACASPH